MGDKPNPKDPSLPPDYRAAFFTAYHTTNDLPTTADPATYAAAARQYAGRWAQWLPSEKNVPILDLGCGAGEFLHFLWGRGYHTLYGVDLNAEGLALGRTMGLPNLSEGNLITYLVNHLAAERPPFGLIAALNVFEHLHKAEIITLLGLIRRALTPSGRLIAVTPNGLSPFGGATRYWDFTHETGFTPAAWRQLARLTGFSAPIFEEYGAIPHSWRGRLSI